jgi:hypothetical protein
VILRRLERAQEKKVIVLFLYLFSGENMANYFCSGFLSTSRRSFLAVGGVVQQKKPQR